MSLESPVTETTSPAPDYTQIPASAFPEGADPSTYKDSLSAPETPAKPERPAHIPEKFWDADAGTVRTDDLVKSYAELEAKHRSPKSEDKPADEAAKPNDLTIEPAKDETPAQAEANPVTTAFEAFAKHYEETSGQPGEDQIAEIVKLGVPQSIVDNYLAGLSAMSQLAFQQAHATAGGEDVFNAASDWASKSLTAADIDSYNTLVTNPTTAKQGVEWLVAKYKAAHPSEGSFVESMPGAAVGDVFRSKSEMVAAMKTDRYQTDRAYVAEVAEKVARSQAAGTLL
ncbi:capsid assembly protein [Brevundimonas vesicularis]|uniref:Capsid assembly protein n=1 Tax=Brevundimonas vesicularis TaxID=41276 RepID=A0ABU4KM56_BREVE|nr:hypothetical protein [Brevundimonas vesicularis]MDX2334092.1 hypothetical protein [Brevundimonas vesicularis]